MCGRYFFDDTAAEEAERELNLKRGSLRAEKGDITPGMTIQGIVRSCVGGKEMDVRSLFWGMMSKDSKLVINARAESVSDKPMFSDSVTKRRCLLPATGFYEWDRDRTKFVFKRPDARPIYLAGFYDLSGNRDSFVIITTRANDSMKPVHDRMPVMIDGSDVRTFLNDSQAALDMLREPMPQLQRSSDYEQLSLF